MRAGPSLVLKLFRILSGAKRITITLLIRVHRLALLLMLCAQLHLVPSFTHRQLMDRGLPTVISILIALAITLDDTRIVLGAAAGIEKRVDIGMVTASAVLAEERSILGGHRIGLGADVNFGLFVDAALLELPLIEADIDAMAFHLGVQMLAPGDAQILGGHAWRHLPAPLGCFLDVFGACRGAYDLAPCLDIGIAEDQMAMRVVLVFALVVERSDPGDASFADLLHEALDRLVPLLAR